MTSVSLYTEVSVLPVSETLKPFEVSVDSMDAAAPVMPPPFLSVMVKLPGSVVAACVCSAGSCPESTRSIISVHEEFETANTSWPSLCVT